MFLLADMPERGDSVQGGGEWAASEQDSTTNQSGQFLLFRYLL